MRRGIIPLLIALALCGCKRDDAPQSDLPTAPMAIGDKTYTLEIAARDFQRNHGLMERDSMPADHGMIFLFRGDVNENFWMENTRIPLDILYITSAGKVITIKHMEPYKRNGVSSDGTYRYAVELNAGQADASGIKQGDTVKIPEAVKSTPADP